MIKATKICNQCRKPKRADCDRCKPSTKHNYNTIDQSNNNLYNSRKWRKFSKQFKIENPLCKKCLQEGRTTPSYVSDHIQPIRKGGAIWDKNNLQALCKTCNAKKTAKD